MTELEKAVKIAKSNLRVCYTQTGIFAGLHQFKDYWARDALFACFGALAIKDYEIVKKTLELFLKTRNKRNQVPLRIGKTSLEIALSYLGLKSKDSKRIAIYYSDKNGKSPVDQNSLLIIIAYEYFRITEDREFIKNNIIGIEQAMSWNLSKDIDTDLLIEEEEYCNWADSIKKKGKVLYSNVCHCHALKCLSDLFFLLKTEDKHKEYLHLHDKVKRKINELFWSGEHYVDWIENEKQYNYFSTDGNILAILWEIADKTKARHIEESSHIFDVNEIPSQSVHPNYPDKYVSLSLKLIGLGDYHNGLSWLWLGCINALAKYHLGMKKEAKELLYRIAGIVVKHNGVYEVYEKNGNPVKRVIYRSEQPFAWSSGIFLYAENLIK